MKIAHHAGSQQHLEQHWGGSWSRQVDEFMTTQSYDVLNLVLHWFENEHSLGSNIVRIHRD